MEGVENINSVNIGGTSTASTESQGTLNNLQQQTTAGLEASIHAQAHTATFTTATFSQQNDTNKTQPYWTVIGKSQKITLLFPLDLASSQNDTEKKNHVFSHVVRLICIFSTTTIKGVKMIKVICETEDAANKVMAKTIMVNNPTKFSKMESFTQNQPDLQSDFEIKIWNVSLDIEKDLFEQHLRSLGTNGEELLKIVTYIRAKAVFVLKNCFSQNYEKERFAWFYFNSIDNMNAAKKNHFAFNNKGLHFVDKNALTCHVCGSINHKVRNCPKNSQLKHYYGQQTAYQDIYKQYKVEASKPKSDFKPIFLTAKEDFIPSDMNWADDWDAKFSAKPPPSVSQNKTGFNPKSNHILSKNIPSNIPQLQDIKQFEQRLYNLKKKLDKSVNSNVNSRFKKVEQQLNKFNNLIKKFNDRIVNLKMHMLNQSYNKPDLDLNFSLVTDSFVNAFNKKSIIDEDVSDTNKSTTSQDFSQDAMEHDHNPIVQRIDEIEDKVNNACSLLETMNNRLHNVKVGV
ncbi:hypothetical protein GLOIN_2v1769705 [Rhizophagus clarus]|uniref:CCHC-type domain-containing protein n=1 Tax=Rhizophagus clarus TaxID=94130 RepID=A0A8H3L6V5_9GLOM|nr:hypothetical protein GLOIN_2v1769705 [Rhizophagus clarus]